MDWLRCVGYVLRQELPLTERCEVCWNRQGFKGNFENPKEELVYMTGNSRRRWKSNRPELLHLERLAARLRQRSSTTKGTSNLRTASQRAVLYVEDPNTKEDSSTLWDPNRDPRRDLRIRRDAGARNGLWYQTLNGCVY